MGLEQTREQSSLVVKMKLREFTIPPITDALVIGSNAPIGSEALRRAISLLHAAQFESVKIEDDLVEEILVRTSILKKISKEKLINIVLKKVKPFMSAEEVIHLDIEVELTIEELI